MKLEINSENSGRGFYIKTYLNEGWQSVECHVRRYITNGG